MSLVIDCPSGLQVKVRGLKGKEGKLLADKTAIRQGTVLDNILVACTEEVLDPGPYEPRDDGKIDWNKALLGDRFYALLQIRIASFGPAYSFKAQCKEGPCRARFDYEINLDNDLEVKPLSPEDKDTFQGDGIFSTTLSDGAVVKYKLATGADERMLARHRGVDRALVDMLAMRITSIEAGDDISTQKASKNVRVYLDDQPWSELVRLLRALDSHDCGVKTEIEIECPECGAVQEVTLPFERSFFLPMEEEKFRQTK